MSGKIYEPTTTRQTLNRVRAESMPFQWSINPYRGCAHGCSFCYARAFQGFIGLEAGDEFQNHIRMKMNAAEALEHQLARIARKYGGDLEQVARHVGSVAVGTATDPYQPAEGKARLTRRCLEVLARYRIPTSVTTRSPLIVRDLDVLARLRLTSVNVSLNTLRPELVRKLEPGAPLPAYRLRAVERLAREGIPAGVFVAPILPCLTDSQAELDELLAAVKSHRAAFAMTSLLRLSPEVKAWYLQTLQTHFPRLLPAYLRLYEGHYAHRAYLDTMKRTLSRLLEKHGLAGEAPSRSIDPSRSLAASFAASQQASVPKSVSGTVPEQLSFALPL